MKLFRDAACVAVLCGVAFSAKGADTAKPKVVFVCEHGAAKSVLAAAEFEKLAKEKGLAFAVLARGTNIDPELAPGVVKGLGNDGLKPSIGKPIKIEAKDLVGASKVVTFGPDLSGLAPSGVKILDWSDTPSPGQNYTAARDYIRKQLENLLAQLEAESKRK